MESAGGMNKCLRYIINKIIKKNSITNKDFAIKIKNYYIAFSIKWIKLGYRSIFSHIS